MAIGRVKFNALLAAWAHVNMCACMCVHIRVKICLFFARECCLTSVVRLFATQVRRTMQQVLQALSFVHQRGVVHRDLKFENILKR